MHRFSVGPTCDPSRGSFAPFSGPLGRTITQFLLGCSRPFSCRRQRRRTALLTMPLDRLNGRTGSFLSHFGTPLPVTCDAYVVQSQHTGRRVISAIFFIVPRRVYIATKRTINCCCALLKGLVWQLLQRAMVYDVSEVFQKSDINSQRLPPVRPT